MYKLGSVQKKVLLTLLGGVALGSSSSPRQYFKTLGNIQREWKNIDGHSLRRSVQGLSKKKLLKENKLPDGSIQLVLTKEGKEHARKLSLLGNSIKFKKPKKWDGKWRLVIFDIPEKDRLFRNILRSHLRELNFLKLQHSVFISPYPFEKMIIELASLYEANSYVRVITASKIDNESEIKRFFSGALGRKKNK